MIYFTSKAMTGSGWVRCAEIALKLGCGYGFVQDPIPNGTKLLIAVQRELPEQIPDDCIVVVDVIDYVTPLIDDADAVIVPTEYAKEQLKGRNSNIFVITNHHMNRANYVVPLREECIGVLGYVGHDKCLLPPPRDMEHAMLLKNNVTHPDQLAERIYPMLEWVDIMWNLRHPDIDTTFKTGAKSKNAMSWGLPSINSLEPAIMEMQSHGCIACTHDWAPYWFKELSNSRVLYKEMREAGLKEARQWHIDEIALKYQAMFKELLG